MNIATLNRIDASLAAVARPGDCLTEALITTDDALSVVRAAAVSLFFTASRDGLSAHADDMQRMDDIIDTLKTIRSLMPHNYPSEMRWLRLHGLGHEAQDAWGDWLVEMVIPARKLVAQSIASKEVSV